MKNIFAILFFICASSAYANQPSYRAITCLDANSSAKAPLFFDVQFTGPIKNYGVKFGLGNTIHIENSDQTFNDATVTGYIDSVTADAGTNHLTIHGSHNSVLVIDLKNRTGLVSGLIKYDPIAGVGTDLIRVSNYAVICTLTKK